MSKKSIIIGITSCVLILVFLLFSKPRLSKQDAALFSYLFGAVNDSSSKDISAILANQDQDEKIFDLFIYIGEKSNYGDDFSKCTITEQNFYMFYNFHEEVGCGGVEQFIYNYYNNHEFALEAFKEMNLPVTSEYLQQAVNIYPQKRVEISIDDQLSEQLTNLDNQYYDQHDQEFYQFIYSYVEQHNDQFK